MLPQNTIFIQGDTIELQFQLFKNKTTGEFWNLLDQEIRFQLNSTPIIYKATENVVGGSDEQINLVTATEGIFLVTVPSTESKDIKPGDYNYEIQITTSEDKVYTVLQSSLRILDAKITWEDIPV